MNNSAPIAIYFLLLTFSWSLSVGQNVTVYDENFDGQTHTFNMTGFTSGLGSPSTGEISWKVNDEYQGGTGSYECMPLVNPDYTAPNIPAQPVGVVNAPNSSYLHIVVDDLEEDGIENAALIEYSLSCLLQDNIFVKMQDFVSTENLQDVILSFYWLCGGGDDTRGSVYYKTIGGSWTQITNPVTHYQDQPQWTQQFIQLPAFENQEGIKFGFLFEYGFLINNKRGFSIDDVRISATDVTVGINYSEAEEMMIQPNPAADFFSVQNPRNNETLILVTVYDMAGRKMLESSESMDIDISHLDPGNYLVYIKTENGTFRSKLLKN